MPLYVMPQIGKWSLWKPHALCFAVSVKACLFHTVSLAYVHAHLGMSKYALLTDVG